jgi:uncharacterized FlaG/YvyC family protein
MRVETNPALQAQRDQAQKVRPEVRELKPPDSAASSQRSLRFQKHQGAGRWMVQVVDVYNNEIIREIPNRKALDVVGEMKNLVGKMQDVRC